MDYEAIKAKVAKILAKLQELNPESADRFKLGAAGLSVLYSIDDKTDGILYSTDLLGNIYSCQTPGTNKFPTITLA